MTQSDDLNTPMTPDNSQTDILDNLKTAILLVEPDLTVTYLNTSAEALLEISGSRVIGEPINTLFYEVQEERDSLFSNIRTLSAFTKREVKISLTNRQTITVDCAFTPIYEGEETIAMVVELQPLDRLLKISREENILEAQQTSQKLVRGMAHEIKNPLGGLRGAAQLLEKQLPDESLSDYTGIIIEEADRLSNLVDRMLGSNTLLDIKELNIHEILERVRSLIEAETSGHIQVKRDYDPSLPEFMGDREQLIQAVLNVVRNAMQALQQDTDNHQPTITLKTRTLRQLTLGTHRHRLVCQVEINDNGPGIPDNIMDTLFLPMVSGRADGTGLGLSIAQSIINHHKGLIECNSQPGNTTFALYIPLEQC